MILQLLLLLTLNARTFFINRNLIGKQSKLGR